MLHSNKQKVDSLQEVLNVVNHYVQSDKPEDLLNALIAVGAHLGHPTKAWNPKMSKFLAKDIKNKSHIINLKFTIKHLLQALDVIYQAASSGQKILFVCTEAQLSSMVADQAKRCFQNYIVNRWLGGTLTNWQTLKANIKKMKNLETYLEGEEVKKLKKKEILTMKRHLGLLKRSLGGIESMTEIPTLIVLSSIVREKTAIDEINKLKSLGMKITSIALADSNSSPEKVDYAIPSNDDSIRCVDFIFTLFANTILSALSKNEQALVQEMAITTAQ